jgi:colanic acid/amylovoran biosynthesis glycosyltransferase
MRVVLVVPTFPQGSETFIVSKAVGLLDRGVDVQIVCSSSPAAAWAAYGEDHPITELRDRVHLRAPSLRGTSAGGAALHHSRTLREVPGPTLRRYLRGPAGALPRRVRTLLDDAPLAALEPDVVHAEFGSLATGLVTRRDALGAAVTVSFRGYDLAYAGIEATDHYRPVWDHADGIHVLSHGLWRRAVRRGAPEHLHHTVIPPAIDTTAIVPSTPRPEPLGGPDRPVRLLSVGRLHWVKGYDHLLDAIGLLRDRGLSVEHRIVGDGDLWEAMHWWRHQLDLDREVQLLGAVGPDEVADHLRWADVFVHASTSEGFCNAVLEAQAHGVPVVTSDADGLPENVVDGRTGIVVPRRDPASMSTAIAELAGDPDRRSRFGAAGAERAREEFRLDDQLDAWIDFYERASVRAGGSR